MAQKVLITAGAGGIGLAVARRFAASGAQVHVLDIDQAALSAAAKIEGIAGSLLDISDFDAVGPAVETAVGALGGLDVLVSNAGIAGPTAPVGTYPLDAWRKVVDVNLTGTFAVTAAAIPHLTRSDRGTILIMSSLAGRFGYPNRSAYSSTKWGLIGLTKTLAMELGPDGISCNAILPGAVVGGRIEAVLKGRAEAAGTTVEEERRKAFRNHSVQRFVTAEEIAELACFLAGPTASGCSVRAS